MFKELATPAPDPILGISAIFAADPSPHKVDLGIGIYKDENGQAPVLRSVKKAEAWLAETQGTKAYISSSGNEAYNSATVALLFGGAQRASAKRARAVQTPGGTAALRLAGDFIRRIRGRTRIFLPEPTWPNHLPIFEAAGHAIVRYPYYDIGRVSIQFDAMCAALSHTGADDVVLIQGPCHNPTGADLSAEQWLALADICARTGALVLIDQAYTGFAEGIDEDCFGLRAFAERLPEMLVAMSYSKNFAVYRDRVGALVAVGSSPTDAAKAHAHLLPIARYNYSMPPDHGAAVVAHVLDTPDLHNLWAAEVATMRERIRHMRDLLAAALTRLSGRDYAAIARQNGMFTLLPISEAEVDRLRAKHVYMSSSGRINVAGLTEPAIETVAAALAPLLHGARLA